MEKQKMAKIIEYDYPAWRTMINLRKHMKDQEGVATEKYGKIYQQILKEYVD